jgi:hypothetical protein
MLELHSGLNVILSRQLIRRENKEMPTKPKSLLDKYLAGQAAEWNVFVCGPRPINIDGVRAFNPGDAVPASHVTRGIVDSGDVIARDDESGMSVFDEVSGPVVELPGSNDAPDPDTVAQVKRAHGGAS